MAELTKRLQLLLSESQLDEIKQIASENQVSVAELIRQSVFASWRPSHSLKQLNALNGLQQFEVQSQEFDGEQYFHLVHK